MDEKVRRELWTPKVYAVVSSLLLTILITMGALIARKTGSTSLMFSASGRQEGQKRKHGEFRPSQLRHGQDQVLTVDSGQQAGHKQVAILSTAPIGTFPIFSPCRETSGRSI
jgi:hypothetical protein